MSRSRNIYEDLRKTNAENNYSLFSLFVPPPIFLESPRVSNISLNAEKKRFRSTETQILQLPRGGTRFRTYRLFRVIASLMETDFEAVQTFSTRLKSIWRQLSKFRFLGQPWAEDVIRVKQSGRASSWSSCHVLRFRAESRNFRLFASVYLSRNHRIWDTISK